MIRFSIILIGFTAMVAQIVFMRELLVVFYGNELSISFILASWLIGGAIGSALLGRFADRIKFKIETFAACQMALGLLLPAVIFAIRGLRPALKINIGEILPFFPMAFSSLVILGPICVILGFLFALASRIYEPASNIGAARIGNVYVLEALGSMTGGLLASFILIRVLTSLQIVWISGILNIGLALYLIRLRRDRGTFTAIVAFAAIALWGTNILNMLDERSLGKTWQGFELIKSKNSIYGNIAVVRRLDQYSFFDNSIHLYTIPDELTAETSVHFALLEHKRPKEILLIGGGVGGLAKEILKHNIEHLDYVELDPLIIKMAKENLPPEYYRALKDAKVSIINEDGRYFVKTTDKRYDCVIIALGDPYTAGLNRFYTVEFFREAKKVLNKDGIISFGISSSESYVSKALANFLRSIYATLKKVFNDVKIIPGETAYFIASPEEAYLTYDYNILMARARERNLDIKYVREYYLSSKLSPEKISYTENIVKENGAVRINRDFSPVSYYYGMIFWSTKFRDSFFSKIMAALTAGKLWAVAFGVFISVVIYGLILRKAPRAAGRKRAILAALAATGFTAIALQIVILLSFQIIYGYLFYKIGLILTSFMAGLAIGGFWITKAMLKLKDDIRIFIRTQCVILLYPLILPLVFWHLAGSKDGLLSWAGSNVLFPLLPLIAGFIGGIQFPLANKIYLNTDEGIGRTAGLTYGVDLAGSCLSALLVGTFLIPIIGIPGTCLIVSALNFAILLFLIIS